jgi:hypothetical protein
MKKQTTIKKNYFDFLFFSNLNNKRNQKHKKRLQINLSLLLILFILIGCNNDFSIISNKDKPEKISTLIPLYIYPTNLTDENKKDLIQLNTNTNNNIVIINPNNGPGDYIDKHYIELLEFLNNTNIQSIGYIFTSYSSRDIDEIKNEIDFYSLNYPSISGIFFDEVLLENDDNNNYLIEISNYARSKNLKFITLNPGTNIPQKYFDIKYYDLIVTFEDYFDNFVQNKDINYNKSNDITKQSLLVYGYPEQTIFKNEITKAINDNYDYLYLTTDGDSNPWDSIFNFNK